MVDGDRQYIRGEVRIELSVGSDDTTEFTNAELNRAIDEVTSDITRLMPREMYDETVWTQDITAEVFASGTGNAFVALAAKPIEYHTETVTNSAATTTYTRHTDYEIDYIGGRMKTIDGGGMADSTNFLVTYKRDGMSLDISGLTKMIQPLSVELPMSSPPQELVSFERHGDILFLTTAPRARTQSKLTDKEHPRIWYLGQHTAPTDSAVGTYPRYMDEVVVKGVVAYALFIKAREQALQAVTDVASSRTQLAIADNDETAINTDFASMETSLDTISSELDTMEGVSGKPLNDAITALNLVAAYITGAAQAGAEGALDKVTTHLENATSSAKAELILANTALDKVTTHVDEGTTGADALLKAGDNFINTVNVGSDTPGYYRRYAETKLAIAQAFLAEGVQRSNAALQWIAIARGFMDESTLRLGQGRLYVEAASARLAHAQVLVGAGHVRVGDAQARARKLEMRMAEANFYLAQAASYQAASDRAQTISDRLLADARERHNDYWSILTDRVQQGRSNSRAARLQHPQPMRGQQVPTGE